jgi:hypothetical protein
MLITLLCHILRKGKKSMLFSLKNMKNKAKTLDGKDFYMV